MIINELPKEITNNSEVPNLTSNSIIYAKTEGKYHFPKHKTPYLLAANFGGQGSYRLNDQPIEISYRYFYFLNAKDDLEINFQNHPLETLFILFDESYLLDAMNVLSSSDEQLLDNHAPNSREFYIPGVPFEWSARMQNTMAGLFHQNHEGVDDQLFDLVTCFSQAYAKTTSRIKSVDAIKASTKQELYRRIFLAREFITHGYKDRITLEDVAFAIGMNKFHLLSNYQKIFGLSPSQYLQQLKLDKAKELLMKQKYSVSQACFAVGYESIGSFSNLFARRFNIRPSSLTK